MPISSTSGTESAPSAIPEPVIGFNGQLTERGGWQMLGNGYRAYSPALMRFNSPDTASPFGDGGLNAYVYCLGDPVNRVDPTGHFAWMAAVRTLIASGRSMATWVAPVRAALRRPIPVSLLKNSSGAPFRPSVMTRETLGHLEKKMLYQRDALARVHDRYQLTKRMDQMASQTPPGSRLQALSRQSRQARLEYESELPLLRDYYEETKRAFTYAQSRVGQRIVSPDSAASFARWAELRDLQQRLKGRADPDGMQDMVTRVRRS